MTEPEVKAVLDYLVRSQAQTMRLVGSLIVFVSQHCPDAADTKKTIDDTLKRMEDEGAQVLKLLLQSHEREQVMTLRGFQAPVTERKN